MPVGIVGGEDPRFASPRREMRQEFDLAAAEPYEGGRPLHHGKSGPSQGGALAQGLEPLPKGGVGHAEHRAELGLVEPLDQQEQRRPKNG